MKRTRGSFDESPDPGYEIIVSDNYPIVGAVGMLQFDVLLHRLEHLTYKVSRWVEGPKGVIEQAARSGYDRTLVHDYKGRPLILFDTEWSLRTTMERETDLAVHDSAP